MPYARGGGSGSERRHGGDRRKTRAATRAARRRTERIRGPTRAVTSRRSPRRRRSASERGRGASSRPTCQDQVGALRESAAPTSCTRSGGRRPATTVAGRSDRRPGRGGRSSTREAAAAAEVVPRRPVDHAPARSRRRRTGTRRSTELVDPDERAAVPVWLNFERARWRGVRRSGSPIRGRRTAVGEQAPLRRRATSSDPALEPCRLWSSRPAVVRPAAVRTRRRSRRSDRRRARTCRSSSPPDGTRRGRRSGIAPSPTRLIGYRVGGRGPSDHRHVATRVGPAR